MRTITDARIWYQSFTDPDADRPYFTRLEGYLGSVASPGCQVEVFGIQPGAGTRTRSPSSAVRHR